MHDEASGATGADATEVARFASGGPWEARFGYSRAVRAGELVLVAGTTAIDADGVVHGAGDAAMQTRYVLDRIEAALASAGARIEDVVRTRIYVTDATRADEVGSVHGERLGAHPPATTMLVVAALLDPRMLVEIEAVAYVGAREPARRASDGADRAG